MEEVESSTSTTTTAAATKRSYLIINTIILSIGCGGPLIIRLYFIHGGARLWFASWLQTGGWPLILIPLLINYTRRRAAASAAKLVLMKPAVFPWAAAVGVLTGLNGYMYSYGSARLPVSTSALISASQLAFTAAFAFLLVKQKFTAYSVNAVVVLTVGAAVLGLHTGGDRPEGESTREYLLGFVMTVAGAALYGLVMPMVELTYRKAKGDLTYTLALEVQLVTCVFATLFSTVGMIVNNDFQAISGEAKAYELGEGKYYLVVVWSAIIWQCSYFGIIGIIFYSSSLFSGILTTVFLPVIEILAIIFYNESFKAEKGVSLFLSLWGFISYFYGDIKQEKDKDQADNNSNNNDRNDVLGNDEVIITETELARRHENVAAP